MSGQPDPKPVRAEKPARRARDPLAVRQAALSDRECWACGRAGANGHHLVPRDWTKPGPDARWNTVTLCGSGTSGCHGAYHGNPYTVQITPKVTARRDAAWVGRSIAGRLLHDPREVDRLQALLRFLDEPELIFRFFLRQLNTDLRERRFRVQPIAELAL